MIEETIISQICQCARQYNTLKGIGMMKMSVTSTKTDEFTQDFHYFITSLSDISRFVYAAKKSIGA